MTVEPGRHETQEQRADRNLSELLQELRVTQTGVTVLFSLLLTVPFTQRFESLTHAQRGMYVTGLLLAALASLVLTAPVAVHRLLFAKGQKPRVVVLTNRLEIIGLLLTVLTVATTLLLVTDVVVGRAFSVSVTAVVLAGTAALYLLPPLRHR